MKISNLSKLTVGQKRMIRSGAGIWAGVIAISSILQLVSLIIESADSFAAKKRTNRHELEPEIPSKNAKLNENYYRQLSINDSQSVTFF